MRLRAGRLAVESRTVTVCLALGSLVVASAAVMINERCNRMLLFPGHAAAIDLPWRMLGEQWNRCSMNA